MTMMWAVCEKLRQDTEGCRYPVVEMRCIQSEARGKVERNGTAAKSWA